MGSATSGRSGTWCRALEMLLFAFPPVVGVGVIGLLEGRLPYPIDLGLVVVGSVGFLAITVGIAICLLFDARSVSAIGTAWRPTGWLYAGAAVLVSAPLVGVIYLFRRHRHVGTRPAGGIWRSVVWASFVLPLLGLSIAAVGIVFDTPRIVGSGVAITGAVVLGVFPAGIYRDASSVRARGGSWQPNPAVYLGLAFGSVLLPFLQPIVAGYYLARRTRLVRGA